MQAFVLSSLFVVPVCLTLAPLSALAEERITAKSVQFESTKPFTLIEKLQNAQDQQFLSWPLNGSEQSTWAPVCFTPCRASADPAGVYRVGPFNNVTASGRFAL